MEEGVTIAWSDLNVYAHTQKKGTSKFKRIINGGKVKAVCNSNSNRRFLQKILPNFHLICKKLNIFFNDFGIF